MQKIAQFSKFSKFSEFSKFQGRIKMALKILQNFALLGFFFHQFYIILAAFWLHVVFY